jgi:hypothetical protein
MTIEEKYYALNTALNVALKAKAINARVHKYGIVPNGKTYPYFQSTYRVTNRQPYAKKSTGVLTDFEYVLNFYTAAASEETNDAYLFIPYQAARELITSPDSFIFNGIANVLKHNETPQFDFKGGLEVLQRGLIFECQTVTTFAIDIDGGTEVPIDDVIETIKISLNEV